MAGMPTKTNESDQLVLLKEIDPKVDLETSPDNDVQLLPQDLPAATQQDAHSHKKSIEGGAK